MHISIFRRPYTTYNSLISHFLYTLCIFLLMMQAGCLFGGEPTVASNTTVQESGRKLYAVRCGGCHDLYEPKNYTKLEWKFIVKNMQVRSKITDYEKDIILHYVMGNAK